MNQTAPAIAAMLFLQALAPCQGLFVPDQPPQEPRGLQHDHRVESSLLQVKVTMMDGACTTDLTQTLQNRTGTQQEAWWMLPLPRGASADRFSMTVGGVETESEVLDATKARSIYERIVRQRRDPGLLEYLGTGMLRARVFPIPPHGEVLVKVRYTELLRPSGGITTYRFPLRAAWCDGHGPKKLGFAVEVRSTVAIKTVWSLRSMVSV